MTPSAFAFHEERIRAVGWLCRYRRRYLVFKNRYRIASWRRLNQSLWSPVVKRNQGRRTSGGQANTVTRRSRRKVLRRQTVRHPWFAGDSVRLLEGGTKYFVAYESQIQKTIDIYVIFVFWLSCVKNFLSCLIQSWVVKHRYHLVPKDLCRRFTSFIRKKCSHVRFIDGGWCCNCRSMA